MQGSSRPMAATQASEVCHSLASIPFEQKKSNRMERATTCKGLKTTSATCLRYEKQLSTVGIMWWCEWNHSAKQTTNQYANSLTCNC
eukprot:6281423-Amphidinium_carterae.1